MIAFQLFLLLIGGDFSISIASDDQFHPVATYANDLYQVFWVDHRLYPPDKSVYGARVSGNGFVLDPDGKPVFHKKTFTVDASYDGTNFLVVLQNGC